MMLQSRDRRPRLSAKSQQIKASPTPSEGGDVVYRDTKRRRKGGQTRASVPTVFHCFQQNKQLVNLSTLHSSTLPNHNFELKDMSLNAISIPLFLVTLHSLRKKVVQIRRNKTRF